MVGMAMQACQAGSRSRRAPAWVQGEAAQPSDRQPVRYDTVLDQDDFAVGCFLLAESELARMLRGR